MKTAIALLIFLFVCLVQADMGRRMQEDDDSGAVEQTNEDTETQTPQVNDDAETPAEVETPPADDEEVKPATPAPKPTAAPVEPTPVVVPVTTPTTEKAATAPAAEPTSTTEAPPEDEQTEEPVSTETQDEAEERISTENQERRGKRAEIILIEPRTRAFTERNTANQQPCGSAKKGPTHYLAEPGSRNYFQWRVLKSVHDANCTLRIGTGLDESDFTVLHPRDGSSDNSGKFPCGRVGGHEGKEFRMPKGETCSSCTLQFEWEIGGETQQIHQCADISLMDKTIAEDCPGDCQNDGVCVNGACKCRKGYTGTVCQHQDTVSYNLAWWGVLVLSILGVAGGLFFAGSLIRKRLANRQGNVQGNIPQENQGLVQNEWKQPTAEVQR